MGDKYAIEYSGKQKCFHIDILEKTLERNFKDFKNGIFKNDYKIIEICDSYEIAILTKQCFERNLLKKWIIFIWMFTTRLLGMLGEKNLKIGKIFTKDIAS